MKIPVTVNYWVARPASNFTGTRGDWYLTDLNIAGTALAPVFVNALATLVCLFLNGCNVCSSRKERQQKTKDEESQSFVGSLREGPPTSKKPRREALDISLQRWVCAADEVTFSILANVSLAAMVGMTDFTQLFNLALLSIIPPIMILIAEQRGFWSSGAVGKILGAHSKILGTSRVVYWFPVSLALVFTFLNYTSLVVTQYSSPGASVQTLQHVALWTVLVSQLLWRAVAYTSHGHDRTSAKEEWKDADIMWERLAAFVIVTVCTELVYWAI